MPEVMTAQNFNRRISAEEALILATAGDGAKQFYRRFEIAFNLTQRFEQVQQWADYLDKLAACADVIEFKRA